MKNLFILFVMIIFVSCNIRTNGIDFDNAKVIHTLGKKYDYMVVAAKDTFVHCPPCAGSGWFEWPLMKTTESQWIDRELEAARLRYEAKHDIGVVKDTTKIPDGAQPENPVYVP
jgi:hypothetical protein